MIIRDYANRGRFQKKHPILCQVRRSIWEEYPNNTNGIKNCCEGIANTAYGYSWKYFE